MTALEESIKHLILIFQHHWSSTASHLLPLLPLPWPPALPLLPWKEEGDNMHCKHVFSEIQNENGFSTAAFTPQSTKN